MSWDSRHLVFLWYGLKWASAWDFQQCGMCDQQRLRSAWAYAQSNQSLCWSLEYLLNVKLLIEHHLECISLKGGCTGSYESTLVKMPHCWKSHATAQIFSFVGADRFSKDIAMMTGKEVSVFLRILWVIVLPTCMVVRLSFVVWMRVRIGLIYLPQW